jgi:hypothetical protein
MGNATNCQNPRMASVALAEIQPILEKNIEKAVGQPTIDSERSS